MAVVFVEAAFGAAPALSAAGIACAQYGGGAGGRAGRHFPVECIRKGMAASAGTDAGTSHPDAGCLAGAATVVGMAFGGTAAAFLVGGRSGRDAAAGLSRSGFLPGRVSEGTA